MGGRRMGDRYDGKRLRKIPVMNIIIPFLMKERNDTQVFFDSEVDVSKVDAMIKEKRKQGIDISFLDYFLTILVRTISQYPRMNRFVAGRRIYARNNIEISMVVKKELNIETDETTVKFAIKPDATISETSEYIKRLIEENKGEEASNSTDKFMDSLSHLPRFLYSFIINTISFLDFYGIMPKALYKISPFHTSVFVTNLGSIGIGTEPMYHHLYNFGTCSVFIAMGNRRKQRVIDKDGKISERKVMKLRFVADERIADGFYLTSALKYFNNLFNKPEILEERPEKIVLDDQI